VTEPLTWMFTARGRGMSRRISLEICNWFVGFLTLLCQVLNLSDIKWLCVRAELATIFRSCPFLFYWNVWRIRGHFSLKVIGRKSRTWLPGVRFLILFIYTLSLPITVAARSKTWTIFARSNACIVGSNPTQGMDVCVVLCVSSGLATSWSPVEGVLPNVYRIKKLQKWPRSNKRDVEP
jgi:hypothetical protein